MLTRWKTEVTYVAAGLLLGAGIGLIILFFPGFSITHLRLGQIYTGPESQIGSSAPEFELKDLSGKNVRLSDYRGRVVLLNFWATWCVPCQQEMPLIQSRYDKYSSQLEVLAINFNEPESEVKAYTDRLNLTFEILLDPGAKVQDLYRVRGYPTTYIVDTDGIIRAQQIGSLSDTQLDNYLKEVGVSK